MAKVEVSLVWWKKNKAKTLLKESLSDELKKFDPIRAAYEKSPEQLQTTQYLKSIKAVLPVISQTQMNCSDKHHQETRENLAEMSRLLMAERKQVVARLEEVKAAHDDMRVRFKAAQKAFAAWAKEPLSGPAYKTLVEALNKCQTPALNMTKTGYFGKKGKSFHESWKALVASSLGRIKAVSAGDAKAVNMWLDYVAEVLPVLERDFLMMVAPDV